METKTKKTKIYIVAIVISVALLTLGLTFAYFSATVTNDASSEVNVTLSDKASLTFKKDYDISIDATMSNFVQDGINLSDTSTSTVTLEASGNYTANYYVYFNISENDFEYTTTDETVELLLVILDANNEPVTKIDGLEYVDSGELSGFDVTTATGIFTVSADETISLTDNETSTASTSENYTFTLYFINLDTIQNDNAGKTFESEIIVQAEEYVN